MKSKEDLLKKFEEVISKHQPFIVNYGKSDYADKDIKELSTWDDEKKLYSSETGYWGFELLYEIVRGEVPNTTIEFLEDSGLEN